MLPAGFRGVVVAIWPLFSIPASIFKFSDFAPVWSFTQTKQEAT
jgi:hypothetical protein